MHQEYSIFGFTKSPKQKEDILHWIVLLDMPLFSFQISALMGFLNLTSSPFPNSQNWMVLGSSLRILGLTQLLLLEKMIDIEDSGWMG